MSLNKIQLDPRLLADLYSNTLIESHATAMPEKQELRYLGDNRKNILIVVHNRDYPFLPDQELGFLTNILAACKLSMADIAIVNLSSMDPSTVAISLDQLKAKQVLLFGTDPLSIGLPINFPAFQLQQFNKRTYLYSPALSEVEKDKSVKQKLWLSLKALFGI